MFPWLSAFASVARHFAMAQSEGAAASPSAGGGGDSRDDGFVPVPKDEPLSPAPVRAPTAFVTDPIRPRAVARPFKTTTPIPRLSTAPPPRVSQPSVKKVTSRFFSKATPESAPDGAPLAARGDAPAVRRGGKMRRSHASLPDAVADARAALEDFRAAAAKKNAHKDHGDAAESVLIPFRPFVDARIAAHADAASGEVLFVRETTTRDEDDVTTAATGRVPDWRSGRRRRPNPARASRRLQPPGRRGRGEGARVDAHGARQAARQRELPCSAASARRPRLPARDSRNSDASAGTRSGRSTRRGYWRAQRRHERRNGRCRRRGRRVLRVGAVASWINRRAEGPMPALREHKKPAPPVPPPVLLPRVRSRATAVRAANAVRRRRGARRSWTGGARNSRSRRARRR